MRLGTGNQMADSILASIRYALCLLIVKTQSPCRSEKIVRCSTRYGYAVDYQKTKLFSK